MITYKLISTDHKDHLKISELFIHKRNRDYKFEKTYWLNGALRDKFFVYRGKFNGPSITYNQKGVLIIKKNYKNNLLHGLVVLYNPDGTVLKCENYLNGELINHNCPDQ